MNPEPNQNGERSDRLTVPIDITPNQASSTSLRSLHSTLNSHHL